VDSKGSLRTNEEIIIRDQMATMVGKYDTYMKRITLGREGLLRNMNVELAQIKPGDSVLEIGCASGSLTMAVKRKASKPI
jgi:ubiquinone/menaquinone biosynthesis C-methylase UbiE